MAVTTVYALPESLVPLPTSSAGVLTPDVLFKAPPLPPPPPPPPGWPPPVWPPRTDDLGFPWLFLAMQVPPTPTLLEGMNRLVAEQLGKREGEKVEAKKKSWKRARDPLKEFIGKVANVYGYCALGAVEWELSDSLSYLGALRHFAECSWNFKKTMEHIRSMAETLVAAAAACGSDEWGTAPSQEGLRELPELANAFGEAAGITAPDMMPGR